MQILRQKKVRQAVFYMLDM